MKQFHVAHVVCSDGFAGVERYVLQSAIALHGTGCTVTVIGGAEASMGVPLRNRGIGWLPAVGVLDAIRALRRTGGLDVIVTHMTEADGAGVLAGLLGRVPVVSTRHFASPRGNGLVRRLVGSFVGRRIAGQIAISQFVADHIDGESIVVRTGVPDVSDVDDANRERTVLVLQRLEAEKHTDVALRAWAASGRAGAWKLKVVGEGSQRTALAALCVELGIADSVQFTGFRSDVDSLLATSSVLIAPTPREGLGLAAIEAMASGVAVVAAAGGGHLETVGGVSRAAMFPPGDVVAAGRVLAELIDDPDRRVQYGRELRFRQREFFSVAAQTEATLRLLRAAARGRKSART